MKKVFKKAHEMTRRFVEKYGVDYQAQFGLCLSYLLNNLNNKEEGNMKIEMKELKGTEKQVKFANDIKEVVLEIVEQLPEKIEKYSKDEKMTEKYMELYNNDIKKLFEGYEKAGDFINDWKAVVYKEGKSQRVAEINNILKSKDIKITRRIMAKFQQEYAEQEYQEYMNS